MVFSEPWPFWPVQGHCSNCDKNTSGGVSLLTTIENTFSSSTALSAHL